MMRRKQVRFVGNCQASAIAVFYRNFVGAANGEDVEVIQDLGMDAAALRQAVQGTDVVVVQERDFKHGLSKEELGGSFEVFAFPMVMAGFLWPYANEAHVQNVSEGEISDGPYPAQLGDSFLNRLISAGVSPDEALERYLALDIARTTHLDRLMELYLDRQRTRDAATGFNVASSIEANFRTRRLFLTAEHPGAWLFGVMATQLFDAMNVPSTVTETAITTLVRSPFPPSELPLHPGVIDYFKLSFASPGDVYTFRDEGRFSFNDYVLRYMRYESNALLREAIHMVGREDPSITLQRLEPALAQSPSSIAGHRYKGDLLRMLSRLGEAETAYREAIRLDPEDTDIQVELARMLSRSHQWGRAEEVALSAIETAPQRGPPYVILGEARVYAGQTAEAIGPAREGVRLSPGSGHAYRMLAMALHSTDQSEEAEQVIRRAILIEPNDPDHRNVLGETLEGQQRRPEAIHALAEAIGSGVKNDQTYSLLGNLFMRAGELEHAEHAFAEGAELYGHFRHDLHDCMVQVQQMRALSDA